MAVFNDQIEPIKVFKGTSLGREAAEKLITSEKVYSKDFCLVSTANPAHPKNIYFQAVFFYEPLLTDTPIGNQSSQRYSQFIRQSKHPFKVTFPQKHLYYFPKMLVLQSSKPHFWLTTKFMTMLFRLVFQPYVQGTQPIKMTPNTNSVIDQIPSLSTVRAKEFFLSFLFSFRLPTANRFDLTFKLNKINFFLSAYKDSSLTITEDTAELLGDFCLSKSRLRSLIDLFHCLLLERQVFVVHNKPGPLLLLLNSMLFP